MGLVQAGGGFAGPVGGAEQRFGTLSQHGGQAGAGAGGGVVSARGGSPDPALDAAKEFATLHWYATAAELGQRILDSKGSERGTYAVEVAEWQLYAGSADRARAALRLAMEEGGCTTFDPTVSPVMPALRQYYLLLSEAERGPFATDYLRRLRARGDNIQAVLAGVLLHGLAGDESAARRDIDAWLAVRLLATDDSEAPPEARRWAYVLTNGVQLQSWNLDSLAAYFWRQALQERIGLDREDGEPGVRQAEIQRRLVATEVALAASPEDARAGVAAYLDSGSPTRVQASVAGELMNEDRYSAAIQIDKHLCQVEPGDPEHWRRLFAAYEVADWPDDQERALAGLFSLPGGLPEGLPRAEFVCRWATVRERNGDAAGACRMLETERAEFPDTLPILLQLAQTYARSGRYEPAAAVWRELLPLLPNGTAILGLTDAEDHLGHRPEAIRRLEAALDSEGTPDRNGIADRLAQFYVEEARLDDARHLGEHLIATERLDALPALATALAAKSQGTAAQALLAAAVARARDPETRFRLEQALIGVLPPVGADARPFLRQLARLEAIAKESPALRSGIEATKYKLSRAAGADLSLEEDLTRRWQKGKGDYLAGERLSAFYLDTQKFDRLREVIDQFDHRPMLPDQLLFGIEQALIRAGQAPLALPISERLFRRFPQNSEYASERVAALWKSGQEAAARELLAKVANTAGLHDEIPEKIALLLLGLGDTDGAQRFFDQVVHDDPLAEHSPGSYLQLARIYLEKGRQEEAGRLLQIAYRQDATDDFEPLVNFLAATGQLAGSKALDMPAEDFPLSFRRRARLLAAVAARLKADGRADDARELLLSHAPFLAEIPEVAAELCRDSPEAERGRMIAGLRTAIDEVEPPYPRLNRLLETLVNTSTMEAPAASAP